MKIRSHAPVWTQSFTLGGKRYVSGLFWQSLAKKRATRREEARDLAKELNFDLMVLYKGEGVALAGFANSADGAPKNCPSIAALAAHTIASEGVMLNGQTQTVSNWIGAFRLPTEGWLYLAARDAAIMPQGDVIGQKEEILARLRNDYQNDEWDVVLGDASLSEEGFAQFTPLTIEELIPKTSSGGVRIDRESLLRRIEIDPFLKKMAMLSVLILAAGGSYMGYKHWKIHVEEEKIKEAEKQVREAEAAARAALLPPPWAGKPKPKDMIAACLQGLKFQLLGSWALKEYDCSPTTLSYAWVNPEISNFAHVLHYVPQAKIDYAKGEAKYQTQLSLPAGGSDLLPPLQEQLVRFNRDLKQAVGSLAFGPEARSAAGAIGYEHGWSSANFTLALDDLSPAQMVNALDHPGIRVEQAKFSNGVWNIEGTIYGK